MSASTVTLIVKIFVSLLPVKSVPMLLGVSGSIDFPNPWIQVDVDGVPTASVVVEVAVNHEGIAKFISDCQAYFAANSSTTVWIGVKVWLAGRKYWVGWAERSPTGVGAVIHTQMQWPPNHTSCLLILFIKSLWLRYSELMFPFRRELLRRWILIWT